MVEQLLVWEGRRCCVGALVAGALTLSPTSVASVQNGSIWATLEANRRALILDGDGLHGAGGAWLMERARGARFTLVGESHHNVETPLLTARLLKELRSAGYATYIVESGPETTRLLMEALEAGGVDAGEALLTRFPYSIAFLDRHEELQAAADALALGYQVWGVDQEFMGSPRLLLQRLAELAPDDASKELVQSILDRKVVAFDHFPRTGNQSGGFLVTAGADDFNSLAAAFGRTEGEATRIVEQLRASSEIYKAFGEGRYYDNNAMRVDLIKRNFLAHLRWAGESPVSDRRALIKMGSVHAGRGRTPMHVYDIGNLAAELAFAGGGDSFHVLVLATGSVGADGTLTSWRTQSPHLAPFFDLAAEDHPVVFDLRPLRPLLTQRGQATDLGDFDIALRYDAIVLFPQFRASEAIVPVPGR
jgi:hypothetical protein